MTRHILESLTPSLRALAEAVADKVAGLMVQIGVQWLSGGGS